MAVSASQIARWLKRERERVGLSQTQAAQAAGLSPDAISKWERGEKGIMAENFVALALAYDADVRTVTEILPARRVAEPAPLDAFERAPKKGKKRKGA